MAQELAGTVNFIGDAEFYLPSMKENTLTNVRKDLVKVSTNDGKQTFTIPDMVYAAMNMTVNSFDVAGLGGEQKESAEGGKTIEWNADAFSATAVDASGAEKTVNGSAFSATYTEATGRLELSVTFTYGTMPMALTYTIDGYYTVENAWNLAGAGTEGNPYKLYEAADFLSLASNISADNTGAGSFFELMNDVDFGGNAGNPVQLPAIGKAGITSITVVPWGFDGTFNGNNHTVNGIWHTDNANDDAGKFNGLFASLGAQGTVKNLIIGKESYISSYNYVAAVVSVSKGRIENCTNYADIVASNAYAAGICGSVLSGTGVIVNSTNYGNIKAMTYAAGIVGSSQSGAAVTSYEGYVLEGCVNYGDMSTVNGVGSGGIAGSFSGVVRKCINYGTIDDSNGTAKTLQNTAGIISSASYLLVMEDCVNNGKVLGGNNVGGILANVMKADDGNLTINGCANNGEVVSTGVNVAGILGNVARVEGVVTLTNCANNGAVSSSGTTELIGNLRGNVAIVLGEGNTIAAGLAQLALDPDPSDVQAVASADGAQTKDGAYLRNGKVVIVKNGKTYDIVGRNEK